MQVTVDFLPRTTGDHNQQLLLHYHTGEDIYVSLYGASTDKTREQLQQDSLPFSDQHIIIEPQEGDIWPNRTAEISIIFKPQEAKLYQHTIYCDVTGRESRLPLRIKGESMGPKLQFNVDLLDIGNIFVGSKHSYEVTLCSNTVQQYSLALVVDVHGVGEEVLALPIKASCVIPEVHLERYMLQFQRCFLGFPYMQTIRLINDSNLPAF
ncbi:hypothetical protein AMELA_G00038060 [Ameiurus melas]|uniref:Uncharacterized protein n=1 Tax=Ameiurus melas TaxID=219545 RepID=A0A7J6B8Z5_AMEME|nr:hypothetical protein AMELA_G00038060 [Ameiurus melas]